MQTLYDNVDFNVPVINAFWLTVGLQYTFVWMSVIPHGFLLSKLYTQVVYLNIVICTDSDCFKDVWLENFNGTVYKFRSSLKFLEERTTLHDV